MLHYYKFKDITKNPLLQENLLNKKSVFRVLSTISRDSTITRYTITRVDCTYITDNVSSKIGTIYISICIQVNLPKVI